MPFVNVYVDTLVKSLVRKIEDQRNIILQEIALQQSNMIIMNKIKVNISEPEDSIQITFLKSLTKDSNYLFVKKLGSKILDLVLDFRNNISRIEEIADYIKRVNMSQELSKWLLDQIKSRLLSPGVTTLNILSTYFHIVETLTIIDEDMLSFNQVTNPVKKFLLQRADLINTILSFWKKSPSLSVNNNNTYTGGNNGS